MEQTEIKASVVLESLLAAATTFANQLFLAAEVSRSSRSGRSGG